MDDTPSQENPPADSGLNKLDLTQLQGFSFGTQWSQEKRGAQDDRPRREDRREGGAPDRRDRRSFHKPAGGPGQDAAPAAPSGGAGEQRRSEQPRGEFRGGPRPQQSRSGEQPRGEFRGGPRRDEGGAGRGEPRGEGRGEYRGGPRQGGDRFQADRGPYESPYFASTFYPEDTSFATLAKTIRSSCRTIELFEIARTVIGKLDRFVVVLQRKPQASDAQAPAHAEGAAVPGVKQAPIYISVPDGVPFDTEEGVINHVLGKHLGQFFDTAEVEVDAPKGNYQIINRCTITGELLAPPNYHRYAQIVAQHHANRISRMSLEAYRSKIESVRDPELVNQWLDKMKKVTRYTWKLDRPAAAAPVAAAAAPAEGAEAAAPVEAAPVVEAPAAPAFDSIEEARVHLLTQARDKVVRTTESARFHGKLVDLMPPGEIRRAIEGTLERQRRFPLDTANALRGRLRREGFTIFKKGSKGVSYVCAVKRKFRVPGQTFAESINALITFVESHPMVKAGELPEKFLGISVPKPADKKAAAAAPAEGAAPAAAPAAEAPAAPAVELTQEQREKLARLQGDLLWLVREGYVTEFIDSRLFAPPPMVEARKKEVEAEEHDPENFPEAPAEVAPAPVAEAAPEAPAAGEPQA
jgi:hypothetical protein